MEVTEAMMVVQGGRLLSAEELRSRIVGKTGKGEYLRGFRFVTYFDADGTMEGRNHVGSHNCGEWSIHPTNGTLSVQWDNGWDRTTTRGYDVKGALLFFDSDTGHWRNTLHSFEDGKRDLFCD